MPNDTPTSSRPAERGIPNASMPTDVGADESLWDFLARHEEGRCDECKAMHS